MAHYLKPCPSQPGAEAALQHLPRPESWRTPPGKFPPQPHGHHSPPKTSPARWQPRPRRREASDGTGGGALRASSRPFPPSPTAATLRPQPRNGRSRPRSAGKEKIPPASSSSPHTAGALPRRARAFVLQSIPPRRRREPQHHHGERAGGEGAAHYVAGRDT